MGCGFAGSSRAFRQLIDKQRPFRSKALDRLGVERFWLRCINPLNPLYRVARGVYAEEHAVFPRVLIATIRSPSATACLYSALWLHGLMWHEPADAWLSLSHKGRKPKVELARFFRSRHVPAGDDLCFVGDWKIPTTSVARTVVDFVRYRRRLGAHAVRVAQELALQSGQCRLDDIEASAERSKVNDWTPALALDDGLLDAAEGVQRRPLRPAESPRIHRGIEAPLWAR